MKLSNKRIIKTSLGIYKRAMETTNFIFFINDTESDENASVKMFDREMNLISDNYFAYEAFFDCIESKPKRYTWIAKNVAEMLQVRK